MGLGVVNGSARRRSRAALPAGLIFVPLAGLPLSASASHDEVVNKLDVGIHELASVTSSGEQGDGHSGIQTVSDRGRPAP